MYSVLYICEKNVKLWIFSVSKTSYSSFLSILYHKVLNISIVQNKILTL